MVYSGQYQRLLKGSVKMANSENVNVAIKVPTIKAYAQAGILKTGAGRSKNEAKSLSNYRCGDILS